MSKREVVGRFFGELGLWSVAQVLCGALAAAATYGALSLFTSWGPGRISAAITVVLFLTGTWGSWAAMIWTRNRVLGVLQRFVATIPGLSMMAAGAAWIYIGFGGLFLGIMLMLTGIGMSALSLMLSGGLMAHDEPARPVRYLFGLTVYPVATTGLASAVMMMWLWFVNSGASLWASGQGYVFDNILAGRMSLVSFSTLMITLLTTVLLTNVIPAVCSFQCRQIADERG